MSNDKAGIELRGLSLRNGSFAILEDLTLSFAPGKIHCVLGKNASGKSSLLNVLGGYYHPSAGSYSIHGTPVSFSSPNDALRFGVLSAFQEDPFLPNLTVAEHLMVPRYAQQSNWQGLRYSVQLSEAASFLKRLGLSLELDTPVFRLNYTQKQQLRTAQVLLHAHHFHTILLDEPYCTCSAADRTGLYQALQALRELGLTIIFSSHHIEEALSISDTVTVLEDGRCTLHCSSREITASDIARQLFSADRVRSVYPQLPSNTGAPFLSLHNVSTQRIDRVSLELRRGEILGVSGLLCSGRTGLARAIAGIDPLVGGKIFLNRKPLRLRSHMDAVRNHIGILTHNRAENLLLNEPFTKNISFSNFGSFQRFGFVRRSQEQLLGYRYFKAFHIQAPSFDTPLWQYSAGNQQKTLLARAFLSNAQVLLLDDPTVGLDPISKNEIYNMMNRYVCEGNSIVFISSDPAELAGMCHRIVVMNNRTVHTELPGHGFSYTTLLQNLGDF